MRDLRLPRVIIVTVVVGSLVVACQPTQPTSTTSPNPDAGASTPSAQKEPSTGIDPSWTLVDGDTKYPNAFTTGVLSKSDLLSPDVAVDPQWPVTISANGTIWYENETSAPRKTTDHMKGDIRDTWPQQSLEFNPFTKETRDWKLSLYQGVADPKTGEAGVGAKAVSDDHIVWVARREIVEEFEYDTYELWAADRDGSTPRKIGEGTIDTELDGEPRNRAISETGVVPHLFGDTAYWVETQRFKDPDSNFERNGTSIFAAPVDGSTPMHEAIPGAELLAPDLCAPAAAPSFIYAITGESTGTKLTVPEIRRRTFDTEGTTVSDEQLWAATDSNDTPLSISACGNILAFTRDVQGTSLLEPNPALSRMNIVRDGQSQTSAMVGEYGYFREVLTTPYGVFVDDLYFDFETEKFYSLSDEYETPYGILPGYDHESQQVSWLFGSVREEPTDNPEDIPDWLEYAPIVISHGSAK